MNESKQMTILSSSAGVPGANEAWFRMLYDVHEHGDKVTPRGLETRELLAHRVAVDMTRPAVTIKSRKLSYRFMPAEAAWILSGDNRVATIAPYNKRITDFSDDGVTFFGAYGPKFMDQLDYVIKTLNKDPMSRQAVINIWRENPVQVTRDYPCTLSTQFMIREGRLHTFVTMRSNDVWLGFPYDCFNACMWSAYVLLSLDHADVSLGNLYHTAHSRHLYATNFEAARTVLGEAIGHTPGVDEPEPSVDYASFEPSDFGSREDLVAHLWALAKGEATPYHFMTELHAK